MDFSSIFVFFLYSPIGEVFRSRLRQFPSLVTCCTIDWFSEWPEEALYSVAKSYMAEITEVEEDVVDGLVSLCIVTIMYSDSLFFAHR